jgi:hypothetical protein
MKRIMVALFFVAGLSMAADAGILKGSAKAVGALVVGAAQDVKLASYPVRHPKKSAHGVKRAAKAVGKAAASL